MYAEPSLFGLPNYSAKVQALLKQDNEHARNEYGCNDYQSGFLPQPAVGGPMAEPVALVALVRGNCSFGVKALKAQAAGASAIIVYDGFIDQPDELPKMAGGDKTLLITIPGMLVLHSNGMILQQAYNNYLIAQKHGESTSPFYDGIWVSLSYSLIASDDRVVWDLFTFPGETSTAPFIAAFQPIFKALGDRALFTPHMRIMDGDMLRWSETDRMEGHRDELSSKLAFCCAASPSVDLSCVYSRVCFSLPDEGVACTRENLPCGTQCTNCGRYCRLSPNGKQGPTGADVLTQAVLQKCLYWWAQNEKQSELHGSRIRTGGCAADRPPWTG